MNEPMFIKCSDCGYLIALLAPLPFAPPTEWDAPKNDPAVTVTSVLFHLADGRHRQVVDYIAKQTIVAESTTPEAAGRTN